MAAGAGGLSFLAKILAAKEISDFIQIGLVAWQSAKRFQQSRTVAGGRVGIDGGTVRVNVGDFSFQLPIEDAAAVAGVAGAGGRGSRREFTAAQRTVAGRYLPPGVLAGIESGAIPSVAFASRPHAGQDTTIAASGPDVDRRPFTLREFVIAQQDAARRGGAAKTARELTLEKMREAHKERLAALDAQIARERIAGQRDVTRLEIAAKLELQRVDVAAQFARQEAELSGALELQREKAGFEELAQGRLFEQQRVLQSQEEAFKTTALAADRAWRERVQAEQGEIADYRKNLNADLALARSLDAARKISEVLKRAGVAPAPVVSFASVFGRG